MPGYTDDLPFSGPFKTQKILGIQWLLLVANVILLRYPVSVE
jgi:hypothetical protein